ncbi:immunity 49 family protein [Streptomyces sp. NPDC049813]|uniref:immunity 49 family protein n=1 Tax=Streptomyces sp. NPDC049813 TaxID=3365597 RepID=UPI003794D6B3
MTPHDAPDPQLPLLTVARADRLRGLVADRSADGTGARPTAAGHTAAEDTAAEDAAAEDTAAGDPAEAGDRHPLAALAQRCHTAPEDTWPDLVEEFFAGRAAAPAGGESAGRLLAGACLRLIAPGSEAAAGLAHPRRVAGGLDLALALDGPDSGRLLTDEEVARAGADALWAAGARGLVRQPLRHEEVRLDGHAVLYSVYGDSPFVSSKALVLPELAAEVTGRRLPDAGALVAVPTRHLLAFHPVVDGSAAGALDDLATYARRAYEEGPAPLSPRVYWWHDGRLTSLTEVDQGGRPRPPRPPAALADVLRALHGLDRAGRLASDAGAAPGIEELTALTADRVDGLAADQAGLADAFRHALALAHAHAAADPRAARTESWQAWVAAQRLGAALFTATEAVRRPLGGREVTVPATGPQVCGDARAWLDVFYLTLVTRDRDRTTRLCEVPLDDLRGTDPVDDYVLHWIDVLQSHWLGRPVADVVEKLVTTLESVHPEAATLAPKPFLNGVDYPPVALFHRLLTEDEDAFAAALTEALAQHGRYWGDTAAPRARVALGPLALACLAHDMRFPVDADAPYLPAALLRRAHLEEPSGQG